MADTVTEQITDLIEEIDKTPKIALKRLEVDEIDDADYNSLVGIGLTLVITIAFVYPYLK